VLQIAITGGHQQLKTASGLPVVVGRATARLFQMIKSVGVWAPHCANAGRLLSGDKYIIVQARASLLSNLQGNREIGIDEGSRNGHAQADFFRLLSL